VTLTGETAIKYMLVEVDAFASEPWLWNVDLAETGKNRSKQFVFVLDYDEKAGVVRVELDTTPKGGLGVRGQFVGVGQ